MFHPVRESTLLRDSVKVSFARESFARNNDVNVVLTMIFTVSSFPIYATLSATTGMNVVSTMIITVSSLPIYAALSATTANYCGKY